MAAGSAATPSTRSRSFRPLETDYSQLRVPADRDGVGQRQPVVDRDELQVVVARLRGRGALAQRLGVWGDLLDEDVLLVAVAVQDADVEDGDAVDVPGRKKPILGQAGGRRRG